MNKRKLFKDTYKMRMIYILSAEAKSYGPWDYYSLRNNRT